MGVTPETDMGWVHPRVGLDEVVVKIFTVVL